MALLALADDSTGAADAAAYAFDAGLPSSIYLAAPAAPLDAGFHALSSDSRHLDGRAAAARVHGLLGVPGGSGSLWCKKIDSLLRGNIGAEIEAMLDQLGAPFAVISPALPVMGRGMVGGRLTGVAQPVALAQRLHEQSLLASALIPLAAVRAGETTLAERFADAAVTARLLLVDAETQTDLQRLVAATLCAQPKALLCGSGALVGALAGRGRDASAPSSDSPALPRAPVLAVVGSASAMAHTQIAAAQRAGFNVVTVGVDPLPSSIETDTILCLPAPEILPAPREARVAAQRLAEASASLLARTSVRRLLLAGGDTAASVLLLLGLDRLVVQAVIQPGMPLLRGLDAHRSEWQLVLKAGSHGEPDALLDLMRALGGKQA